MDGYGNNKEDFMDLYPRPASAGCVNSDWCPFDPSSSLFGSTSGERLEHLVKSRPRKPKTRAPTRVSIISTSSSTSSSLSSASVIASSSSSSSSNFNINVKKSTFSNGRLKSNAAGFTVVSDKIDDGLDTFFRKPVLNTSGKSVAITKPTTALTAPTPPKTGTITSTNTHNTIASKIQTFNSQASRNVKQSVKPTQTANTNVDKLQEKSTTSKSPTKAIQKIIKSFEIRVNRESVK